jgi:hypothetical protein
MILIGVTALVAKTLFADSISEFTYSYLGNLSVSFAVYFIVSFAAAGRLNRVIYVAAALLVVESFELADGFGIMANVYDSLDLVANALGVGLAYFLDILSLRMMQADTARP